MTTLSLTVCKDERYLTDILILTDHTDYVNYDMTEENILRIQEILPEQHKNKLILSISKIHDMVSYKGGIPDK